MINSSINRIFIFLLVFVLFGSCREQRIHKLLQSGDQTDIIKGCNLISSPEDSLFIDDLLAQPYDGRISHDLRYKGISVYKAKMLALERVSNIKPPNKMDYHFDSTNIQFYIRWAKEKSLL